MTKICSEHVKPTQTRNNRKKYVNGSVNSERHIKKIKTRRDASLGLYLFILGIKSRILLVRQSHYITIAVGGASVDNKSTWDGAQ
jgi:hypothetical protein